MAKRQGSKQGVGQLSSQAQVRLDVKTDTPFYYVNYIGVSHTPYDFSLTVAKIPSPPTQDQLECAKRGEPIPLEATLQLIIPPLLIDGLISALTDQKKRQAETAAQQVKNNEQQFQHVKPLGSIQ